jgi:O-antigen/teichoic acid export membrane protein
VQRPHLDILKHSAVYGIGLIATKILSVVMLPLYTRYLTPADYGTISILDITAGLLAVLVGGGIAQAVQRFHFDEESDSERREVWWSGLVFVALTATLLVGPAWILRAKLAELTLGAEQTDGGYYYALVLPTMWFSTVSGILQNYVRVRKWSGLFVVITMANLFVNAGLNVWFLVGRGMGVAGVLLGNLLASALLFTVLLCVFAASLGRIRIRQSLVRPFLHFGVPILMTTLLHWVMHEADRYFLRHYLDLEQVGLYSIAYQIGHGFNNLLLVPFMSIWTVVIYEIAEQPGARETYARVFRHYVGGALLAMLGVSLFARPILTLLTTPEYYSAAEIVPIVCLAYIFFGLDGHFRVPALIAKRTVVMLPAALTAAIVNLVMNMLLIPRLGAAGAGWASVVTFASFSSVGLWRYRRIDRYPYPLGPCFAILLGMVATYLGARQLRISGVSEPWTLTASALVWIAWALFLFGPLALQLRASLRSRHQADAAG